MKPGKTGITRLIHASKYSWQGIKAAWRCESAFRQEIALLLVCVPVALTLPVTGIEKLMLIITLLAVVVVELLNSAIEAVVDRVGSEIHELSGQAKDMGSAAVLFACIIAAITWAYVLYNHFLA